MTIKEYLDSHSEIWLKFPIDPDNFYFDGRIRIYTKETIYAYYPYMLHDEIVEIPQPEPIYKVCN